jgi:hypothetical protein
VKLLTGNSPVHLSNPDLNNELAGKNPVNEHEQPYFLAQSSSLAREIPFICNSTALLQFIAVGFTVNLRRLSLGHLMTFGTASLYFLQDIRYRCRKTI